MNLLYLIIRSVAALHIQKRNRSSEEERVQLFSLEQISSIQITKNRNWGAGAFP